MTCGRQAIQIQPKLPQTNGICERFHRTVQEEFYSVRFARNCTTHWESFSPISVFGCATTMKKRAHGKYCFGTTPLATFRDSAHLALEKMLDRVTAAPCSDSAAA